MQQRILTGLIGANIQRSLSPALFEGACASKGIRGHYHLMDLDHLPGRNLAGLLQAARDAGFAGANITYPCKEAVVPLLHRLSSEAREIGAVNTVSIDADGTTTGYNTDRTGFRRAFDEALGARLAAGKTAMLVGAGGAGRAVAFALFDLGLRHLLVSDKNGDPATALVGALETALGAGRAQVATDPLADLSRVDGVVNATPVGMLGLPGNPIPLDAIASTHWVADVIYTPLETELVTAARGKQCLAMGGAGMCVHQAVEAFKLFTGLTADVEQMRRTFAQAAADREKSLEAAL